jgi:predicted RNA-binding Zn-ribbon protein involved in translation (DUF1610 family)
MTTPIVSAADYEDATSSYLGWCSTCQEFTREETEPDAAEYECPECGEPTVTGAEDAALLGLFRLDEGEEV